MFTAIVFVVSFVVHGIEGKTTETVNVCERFLPLQVFKLFKMLFFNKLLYTISKRLLSVVHSFG